MDSLFEGMVLFDPTQSSPPSSTQPSTPTINNISHNSNHQPELPPSSPAADVSQPLDENLFSDLTLVAPQIHQTLAPPSPVVAATPISTKPIARQSSSTRKKKRAAGLRIGYKKDEIDSVADSVVDSVVVDSVVKTPSSPVPVEGVRVSEVEKRDQEVELKVRTVDDDDIGNDLVRDDAEKLDIGNDLVRDDAEKLDVGVIGDEEDRERDVCSIEVRFERIRSDITENLRRVREQVDSVSEKRKESIRRRRKAAEDLSLASAKFRELERQLEEACEAEDFETADRLSDSLASADSEKERLAAALRDADAECDAVDVKMQGVLDLQIAAEEECASLLQSFSMVSNLGLFKI